MSNDHAIKPPESDGDEGGVNDQTWVASKANTARIANRKILRIHASNVVLENSFDVLSFGVAGSPHSGDWTHCGRESSASKSYCKEDSKSIATATLTRFLWTMSPGSGANSKQIAIGNTVGMGRFHERELRPHARWSYQIVFSLTQFSAVVMPSYVGSVYYNPATCTGPCSRRESGSQSSLPVTSDNVRMGFDAITNVAPGGSAARSP